METRLEHPETLAAFEAAPACRARAGAGAGLGLWLALGAIDWTARIGVFHWQSQWLPIRKTAAPATETAAAVRSRIVPAQTGAGLTQMVPSAQIAARYAEVHPAYVEWRDAAGYYNAPLPEGHRHAVAMLGDSFMLSLGTQNVAQVLAAVGGIDVYNHAMFGAGPFLEMPKFIGSGRFDPLPPVVIWNLSARELGASLFVRQPVEAWFRNIDVWADYKKAQAQPRLRWEKLAPAELGKAFPNTSLIAYFGRRAWSQVRLVAFRAWPRDVLGADDPQFGPMLFYRENLRMLPLLAPEENAAPIVKMVAQLAAKFRERGATLVVLLVPEKEQIHARALPLADQAALADGDRLLAEIAQGLEAAGVPAVNLMPTFRAATDRGQRLYWRDDTHWNDAGIRLAAEELWRKVEPLLK